MKKSKTILQLARERLTSTDIPTDEQLKRWIDPVHPMQNINDIVDTTSKDEPQS
jgi:hypothetical protein